MEEVTPVMFEAKLSEAAKILHDHILTTHSPREISLARAIYNVKNTQWTKQHQWVLTHFGGKRPSATVSLADWHNDALGKATAIVSWETRTNATKSAYANRRKSYEDYLDAITNHFDRFQGAYKQLAPSIHTPPFAKTSLTSVYVMMLKREALAWYDRQRPTDHLVLQNPQEGMVRFMIDRREMAMMLKICHAKETAADRQTAFDASMLQLTLAPVLGLAVGLYKPWDGTKILKFKGLTEMERAVLAMAMLVPAAARILKAGKVVYAPTRLAQIYSGDPAVWKQAIGYSAVLSKHRSWQRALDDAYKAMEPGVKLSGKALSDASTALPLIVSSPSRAGSFLEPAPIELHITELWTTLKSKYPWLATAMLDEYALRRVLLMGPNLSHIEAQLLAELAESRVAIFLRDRNGIYSLGIEVPDGCTLEFVPGHAFRAGDKNPDIANRQISDGVIGYWNKGIFCVAAILEVKVDGLGGRELGHAKTSGLMPEETAQLRAFSKREWVEANEVAERKEEVFKKAIGAYDSEILKLDTGSQVARDIGRLDSSAEVRINGVLARFQLLQDPLQPTTKILAVVPRSTEPEDLKKEITEANGKRNTPFQFEPFAVPVTAAQLKRVAQDAALDAGNMVQSGTPAEFVEYLKKIHDLALRYGDAKDANVRVMEWLRHIDYNSFKFQQLVTSVDDDWISFVGKTVGRGDMIEYVADPQYPVNIKVSHFGYSMNGVMHSDVPSVDDINRGDIAGWGGDWITFYGEWQRDKVMPGSQYCRDKLARPGDTSTFKLRDIIEDVDAFNIASTLLANPTRTIVQEVEALFKPGGGYTVRFSRFFKTRFGGKAGAATKVAKKVLTYKGPDLLIVGGRRLLIQQYAGENATMPSSLNNPADLDDFCKGFEEVLTRLAASG